MGIVSVTQGLGIIIPYELFTTCQVEEHVFLGTDQSLTEPSSKSSLNNIWPKISDGETIDKVIKRIIERNNL